jgi:hypothetical protein
MDSRGGVAPKQSALEYLQAQRRIALVLAEVDGGAAKASSQIPDRRFEQAMLVVARHAATANEFETHRKRLASLGRSFRLSEIFDLVVGELPGWCAWLESADGAGATSSRAALRRLVHDGQTPGEAGKRFVELVRAAVKLVERGSLGRGASVLAEAERLSAAVPPEVVESVRRKGFEGVDLELLRSFASTASERLSLRQLLRFFRTLEPVPLLQALAVEEGLERRRLLLALIEAHGEPARREALDLLRSEMGSEPTEAEVFLRRNLLVLLRHVPRSGDGGLDEEVEILARNAAPRLPPIVVKEAIGALGQLSGRRSEQALERHRQLLDAMLAGKTPPTGAAEDLRAGLAWTQAALARRVSAAKGASQSPSRPTSPEPSRIADDSLPGLLQRLAEDSATGNLVIEDKARGVAAAFTLSKGRLTAARAGNFRGADALYQFIETFDAGLCVWSPQGGAGSEEPNEPGGLEVRPLVLEGLRRRDEFRLARAIVPDDAVFASDTSSPQPFPEERDGLVTRDVWAAAAAGRSARDCEAAFVADAYRIRRLYLHWLEEGALVPREEPST